MSVVEQKIMQGNDIHPAWMADVQGFYEFLIILFIIFPILHFVPKKYEYTGLHENLCESLGMIFNSKILIILFIIYVFFVLLVNISIMGVELMMGATEALTQIIMINPSTWFIGLFIYYVMDRSIFGLTPHNMGVPWNNLSYLTLTGTILIVLGFLFFTKTIRLRCFEYEKPDVVIFSSNSCHNVAQI